MEFTPSAPPSHLLLTVLAAAGLVDGCRDSNGGDCGGGGGSGWILLSLFLLDTRDGWCVGRKVVQDFPVERNSVETVSHLFTSNIAFVSHHLSMSITMPSLFWFILKHKIMRYSPEKKGSMKINWTFVPYKHIWKDKRQTKHTIFTFAVTDAHKNPLKL